MYSATTRSLKVTVIPYYMENLSSPSEHQYVWEYKIYLENKGNETVQLLKRHWQVVDYNGNVQEIMGDGVVGQQPILHPGEGFVYTSHTNLNSSSGIMTGKYSMRSGKQEFDIDVPAFSLDIPKEVSIN
jgi:ApaG protein